MKYRIGLDIGIASVGWAVIENDSNDEPKRIENLGVRIFEEAEIPKTGESLAAPRRDARTTRRRLRRRKHRLDRIKNLLEQSGIISKEELAERYQQAELPDVYRLRYEGLDRVLSNEELAQVLIHIAKHRGFRSTRKAETKEKEAGQVLDAVKKNEAIMEEKQYRTVGEMIYRDAYFKTAAPWSIDGYIHTPRNTQGDYKHTILRSALEEEVKYIFEVQRKLGNEAATKELEEKYLAIFNSQRSFDKGPGEPSKYAGNLIEGMVGTCTFEGKAEKRAAKACYTSERFVLLQKVNNIRIVDKDRETRALSPEERAAVIDLAYGQKEIKYTAIRKAIQLGDDKRFKELNYTIKDSGKKGDKKENINQDTDRENYKKTEDSNKFFSLQWYHQFKKALYSVNWDNLQPEDIEMLDDIGNILTMYKEDGSRKERLAKYELNQDEIDELLGMNPSKFQHLSLVAMKKIMPYLEQGDIYNVACDNAGYNFKADSDKERMKLLKGEIVEEFLADISNPVVKRSISQTIKVLNAIIREYGSPQAVHIELAREMSKNYEERTRIEKENKKNRENNEAVKKQIMEYGVANPTGQDILKFRLWQDQNETCMYTGEKIPLERLFQYGEYDIDHIIPYSKCFDDSYKNKVLVKASANREKGNRLPYEYFGNNEITWGKYEELVNSTIRDYRKRDRLLKKSFTEEEQKAFKERNITDTKYITTAVYNLIRNNLIFDEYQTEGKKKKVYAVNGAVTAYLRKRWGIDKSRETDTHHAKDAVVVACATDGMINRISRSVQARELEYARDLKFVDVETGEIYDRNNFTRDQWDEMFGVKISPPWNCFKKELDMRMSEDPAEYAKRDMKKLLEYGYEGKMDCKPIFVSRMPKHKVTGAVHAETIRSPRHFDTEGIVITKTDIKSLKLDKNGEIPNYYNPDSDRLLYEALKKQLQIHGNDPEKAFAEPFHKPKADGSIGPVVNKVKIVDKMTMGVKINDGKGVAANANGAMVRIDVFNENGKFFFVPIYISDTKKGKLPNKAVTAHKPYSEWREMEEENFVFSLYPRDLAYIKKKGGIKLKRSVNDKKILEEGLVYFTGANISTASIAGIADDRRFEFEGLGIQSLEIFKKYQVDVLGNITEVKSEKRMGFN